MKFDDRYTDAEALAVLAHEGQRRVGNNEPYVCHPMRVASKVPDDCKVVAVLHDVFEDNEDAAIISSPGRPPYWRACLGVHEVPLTIHEAEALNVLTKRRGAESYTEYINRVSDSNNAMALLVKIEDLKDNLTDMPEDKEHLRSRYEKSLEYLQAFIPEDYS